MERIKLHCPNCRTEVELEPEPCPKCGAIMEQKRRRSSAPPWLVIFLLFFVLGPLALGMLWRNDRFSRNAKIVLTLMVLAYSVALCYYAWAIAQKAGQQIDNIMNQYQMY